MRIRLLERIGRGFCRRVERAAFRRIERGVLGGRRQQFFRRMRGSVLERIKEMVGFF